MKAICMGLVALFVGLAFYTGARENGGWSDSANRTLIQGKWVRVSPSGPVGLIFHENGVVEVDFNLDEKVDVVSAFRIEKDTIFFIDKEGAMCQEQGMYKMDINTSYLAFDLLDDHCSGRVRMTMGFWTRPDYRELLKELSENIKGTDNPVLYLTRARIYMATANSQLAQRDLNMYLQTDTTNARAYVNRAGTRFPGDMEGVVVDCNKAISLEPTNKNAYFLRGLAYYELGRTEEACDDFSRAIELGFAVLKEAEQYRCREYWKQKE